MPQLTSPTFHGKAGENIYIFLDKMKEALSSNQVTEKNRADVFKKHLRGAARNLIDNSQKTVADVEASLLAQ